jgi:hypothetical protein
LAAFDEIAEDRQVAVVEQIEDEALVGAEVVLARAGAARQPAP